MNTFVKTELGDLPSTWQLKRLSDVFETQLGKMLSQKAHGGDSSLLRIDTSAGTAKGEIRDPGHRCGHASLG